MSSYRFTHRMILILTFLVPCLLSAPAAAASWEPVPLWGGQVVLAAAGDLSVVYAASQAGGFFESTDGGVTWRFVGNGPHRMTSPVLEVDPRTPRRLFAQGQNPSTFTGVLFRSEDGGRTWQRSDAGLRSDAVSVFDLAFDPEALSVSYAGTSAGLYRSEDRGETWARTGLAGVSVLRVAAPPSAPDVVLVVAHLKDEEKTLRSADGGATFVEVLERSLEGFVVDPTHPQRVFGFQGSAVYQSDDLGATWVTRPSPWPIQSLAITPDGTLLAAGFASGIRRSLDGGITWTPRQRSVPPRDLINSLVVLGDRVLAGGQRGVWRGTAQGRGWRESSTGLTAQWIVSLAVAGDADSTLWAGTQAGFFRSRDGGATFRRAALGPSGFLRLIAIHPRQPEIAYAFGCCASEGPPAISLLKTEDGGESWQALPYGGVLDSAVVLEIDPRNPDVLYAGGPVFQDLGCNAVRSIDGGATWRCMGRLAVADLIDLAVDPRRSRILYALSGGLLYRSENRGAAWTPVPNGISAELRRIEVDPFRPERLYAAGGQVFRSDNGGLTWTGKLGIPGGTIRDLLLDPARRDRIWATVEIFLPSPLLRSTSRVFRSDDAGENWTEVTRGLPRGTVLRDLAADPRSVDVIYAGTEGQGLYRLRVEE